MGVMERLLTQETEMTQRQKSTLEKAEEMIQRVVKNGGSPLVNCGLLTTYTYILVPEFSSQIMEMTIRESEDKNDRPAASIKGQSSNDVKAASGTHDDGDLGPIHDTSDNSKEDDNKVKNVYSDKRGTADKRIYKQLDAENSDNDVDVAPAVEDKDVFADQRGMTGDNADKGILVDKDLVDKEPAGRKSKGDGRESDDTELRGDNTKSTDRNHNDEFPDHLSENNSKDNHNVLHDPKSNKEDVGDDEGNALQDNSVKGDVIKEKDSLDSKLYNDGKSDVHNMWEQEGEDYDDSEDEDCYYRRDEFVCTRKSRDHNSNSEINKIINGHNEGVDGDSDESKAENIVTDDKTKRLNEDFGGEQNEINNDGNKVTEIDKDMHEHTEENIDAGSNNFMFDEGDSEYKDVNIDTTYNNKMLGEDIDEKKNENSNTDNDDDKIKRFNQDNSKDESEYVNKDDKLAGFNADGNENQDKKIGVKITRIERGNYETGSDDTYSAEEMDGSDDTYSAEEMGMLDESRNVGNNEHVNSNERDSVKDSVIDRDDTDERNIDDTVGTSNANGKTNTIDNRHIVTEEKNVDNVVNDDQQMKSLLNGDENDVNEDYNSDGGGSFQEHVASATSKNGIDKISNKEVSNQEVDQSSDISKTVIANANENGDGVVIFYEDDDDDENDDKEAKEMKGTETHGTSSKGNDHIKSVTQKRISDQELMGSERNKNLNDKDNEYNIEEKNSEPTNIAGDQQHDVTNDKRKFDSSVDTTKQSNFLKQSSDDNERSTITESKQETDRGADKKRDQDTDKISGDHKTAESKVFSEETSYQSGKTLEGQRTTVSEDNSGHTTLDIKQIELVFAQRESEQAAKIQKLELMLFKLENKILTQSVDKQSDTNAFISLENQILKLENELMKLSENYRQLLRDHDTLKSQQKKSYLELEHIKTSPHKSEYPALADNTTSEMIKQQKTRITELSKMIHNQSATAQMLQSRSQYLEEENRKLFQVVLNQSVVISNIMKKLEELGEEGLQTRIQTEDFKAQLENLKQLKTLNEAPMKDQTSPKRPAFETDFGMDSSVTTSLPAQSKDLVSIVFLSFRKSPTARSPSGMFDIRWRCGGLNSTRLCLFHSLIISNCTPFNDLQWKSCNQAPGSLLLERSNEKLLKHGDHVLVRFPPEDQTPEVKHGEALTVEESNMHVQPEEDSNDDIGTQSNDRNNEMKPSAISMLDDNKHGTSRRSADVELEGGGSKASTYDAFKSESDKLPTVKSTSGDELSRKDREGDNIADSLNNMLDLINNGKTDVVSSQDDEGKKHAIKMTATDQLKDNKNNGAMFKGGDDEAFDKESRSKDNMESSTQQDTSNNSHQDPPLQTEHSAGPSGAEATATSPCGHNDRSPECADLNIDKNDANVDQSTLKHDVQAAEVKLLDGKMRKRAAEEAMKTHEALYRQILYKPIYDERPKDCYDLHKQGQERDGLRQIFISGMNVYVSVYCDMTGGGWTTLLKREDGLIDFYRNYVQYKEGFGAARGEHYVGNEVIHYLTNQGHYSLKVELTDWNGTTKHAYYDHFWVDGEEEDFRLHLFGYSGDAGDGLGKHSGMKFSTFDVDNDVLNTKMGGSCAKRFQGAGWYYQCYSSNLMGRYYAGGEVPEKRFDGVAWKPWRGPGYSLKTVVLAVRPFGAE
ncbi:hypothetical protein BsWGS_14801 [Bradybaena similaris]